MKLHLALVLLSLAPLTISNHALNFYIDYSLIPNEAAMQAHDVSIVSPQAQFDMARVKQTGQEIYAYVSVVEVAPDAPYRNKLAAKGIRLLGTNELWQSDFADISVPAWTKFVLSELAAPAAEKNFDGFFLDTVDSYELLAKHEPKRATAFREGLIAVIRGLKTEFPNKKIILNRGFQIWQHVRKGIDGVLVESLFQTFDGLGGKYKPVEGSGTEWLIGHIEKIKSAGVPVYVVDYVDPKQLKLAETTAKRIEDMGCHAFVTTPQLNGICLAPLREAPRRLLVLFGNQEQGAGRVQWPVDSELPLSAQMPLEWLGYEIDFLHLADETLPSELGPKYKGVILDRTLQIPDEKANETVDWLIAQKTAGKKIIFLGQMPVLERDIAEKLFKAFGLTGTGEPIFPVTGLSSPAMSEIMNYEAEVKLLPTRFRDIQAPDGARIHLAVRGTDGKGSAREFDAVFTTHWGGCALEPYVFFHRPDVVPFWLLDPFAFFAEILDHQAWPAPDATTRDGVRVFYSHIDGDGFRHKSTVEKGQTSAEIILEQVIKKYPVPFTCSVIESEIRGLVVDQQREDEKHLTAVARAIFALPKVEAASHGYTHPFFWNADDKQSDYYEQPFLQLIPPFKTNEIDVEREVVGSVRYIEENLLPPGKKVEIFLWTGNCRPHPEAVRLTRELGIENMNGGDTTISRKHPTLTQVAARVIPWGDELQIHAANQNENVYRGRWKPYGHSDVPFYGGYIHAIESFQKTESPRRLKPVNVYFHFYSGDNLMALRALTRTLDWTQEQELHALTATAYAKVVRDCRNTHVFRGLGERWVIVNRGDLRTFRFDKPTGVPDIAACEGVTGYTVSGENLYVHTDGSPRVKLAFSYQPSSHLYLDSSTAEIRFEQLTPEAASFSVRDVRTCRVILGGAVAGAAYRLRVVSTASEVTANSSGRLLLELPASAKVRIEAL